MTTMLNKRIAIAYALSLLIIITLFLYYITRSVVPAGDCNTITCYTELSVRKINETSGDINFWANSLTFLFILTVFFSSVTAVMFGLQDDKTKHWSRPIGLISTTLATAIGTIVSTFNPQGNIDKLIAIRLDTAKLANKLKIDVREIQLKSDNKHMSEEKNRDIQVLFDKFAEQMNDLSDRKARLKLSVGRFNIIDHAQDKDFLKKD